MDALWWNLSWMSSWLNMIFCLTTQRTRCLHCDHCRYWLVSLLWWAAGCNCGKDSFEPKRWIQNDSNLSIFFADASKYSWLVFCLDESAFNQAVQNIATAAQSSVGTHEFETGSRVIRVENSGQQHVLYNAGQDNEDRVHRYTQITRPIQWNC